MGEFPYGAALKNLRARFPRLHEDIIRFELERCNGHAGHAANALRVLAAGSPQQRRQAPPPLEYLDSTSATQLPSAAAFGDMAGATQLPAAADRSGVGGTTRLSSTELPRQAVSSAEARPLAEWAELRAAEAQVALLDAQLELRVRASHQAVELFDMRREVLAALEAEKEAKAEMAQLRAALENSLVSGLSGGGGGGGSGGGDRMAEVRGGGCGELPGASRGYDGHGWVRIHALEALKDAAARLDVSELRRAIEDGEAAGVEASALDSAQAIMVAKAAENLESYRLAALSGHSTWDPFLERAIADGKAAGLLRDDLLKAARNLVSAVANSTDLEVLESAINVSKSVGLMRSELESLLGKSCEAVEYSVLQWKASKYTAYDSIWQALAGGDTVLVRGSWLMASWRGCSLLPRRQELPHEAIWQLSELVDVGGTSVPILAISHCWESRHHPDPQGRQLQILGRTLEQRFASRDHEAVRDVAVFYDWCSLPQRPYASEEERAAYQRALRHVDLWYAHSGVTVWWHTSAPEGAVQAGCRGWPCFEQALSGGLAAGRGALDLGLLDGSCLDFGRTEEVCRRARGPPVPPEVFARILRSKVFAQPSDRGLLEAKYRQAFEDTMASTRELALQRLAWGAAQAAGLATVLQRCTTLQVLNLQSNSLGDHGVWELSGAISWCANLRELDLGANGVGDLGARSLAAAVPTCGCLAGLLLRRNEIGDGGAEALAAALPWCVRLGSLDLRNNRFTKEGVERLEAAWGKQRPVACPGIDGTEPNEESPPGRGLWI